jgi:HEAT repeat protein
MANSRKANASQEALRSAVFRIVDKLERPDNDVVPLLLSELALADLPSALEIIGTLQRIGPVSPTIIPTLIQKLKDVPRVQQPAGGKPMDSRWPSQSDDLIAAALRALQRLARADNDAVPLLIATLPEADPRVAARIVQTLGFIGPLTPHVIPAVVTSLHADDPRIQLGAIGALGTMGPKSAPAVPDMVRLLEAQRAGLTNGPASGSVDEGVERSVRAAVEPVWEDAMPPRMRMRPARALSGPELMALQLVLSLARIGPSAGAAVPTLARLMSEVKSELRYEAALAVWQIERTNAAAKTVLIEGLNIPTPEFPRRLIRYFRSMGMGELPILDAALDHIDEEVRTAAFTVVSTLALEDEPAVLALERIADDSANPLQRRAARALASIQLNAAPGLNAANASAPQPK